MYRVSLNYHLRSIGINYDSGSDLEYSRIESIENTYIYKNLEFNDVLNLISNELNKLNNIKSGEISICYMDGE